MITPEMIREAARRLSAFKPEKVILFGSQARGDANERSDADFLVICKFKGSRRKLWAQMDHEGQVRTFPFVVEVKAKQTASAMKEVFTCPVAGGKTVPAKKASAEHSDYKGVRYYFCCPGC